MDDALANRLVEQTAGSESCCVSGSTVAGGNRVFDVTYCGLDLGLDRAIAHTGLLVGDDALLLRLDVSHVLSSVNHLG